MAQAAALLLAAGRGRRFGADKRQAMGDWQGPLLHHVIGLYRPLFSQIALVIPDQDPFGLGACAEFNLTALVNPAAERGMGSSLAIGIGWAMAQGVESAIIGLGDMPWIEPSLIERIAVASLQSARLVAPSWCGEIGFPRAIPAQDFPRLTDLTGDRGASERLAWQEALLIETDDQGVVQDIDRPQDVRRDKGKPTP